VLRAGIQRAVLMLHSCPVPRFDYAGPRMKPWRRRRQPDSRTARAQLGTVGIRLGRCHGRNPQARPWRRLERQWVPPGGIRAWVGLPDRLPTVRDGSAGGSETSQRPCRVTPPGLARALTGCRFGSAVNTSRSSMSRRGPGQHGQATCSQRPLGPDCTPVHRDRIRRACRDRVRPLGACWVGGRPADGRCSVRRRPRRARPQTVAGWCCGRGRGAVGRRWTCRSVVVRRARLWLAR
jgi:hypothetical protein